MEQVGSYELIHLFKLLCRLAQLLLKTMNVLTTHRYISENTTHSVGIVSLTHSNLFGVVTERSLFPYSSSSTHCADFKSYKIRMRVTHEGVEFKDDGGACPARTLECSKTLIFTFILALCKKATKAQTDRVMTDNTGPQHNLTELRLEKVNATLEYNEVDDINNLNDINAPQLDTADRIATDKVHKNNMDTSRPGKRRIVMTNQQLFAVSPMSCSRALADTCGKVLGNMCLSAIRKMQNLLL